MRDSLGGTVTLIIIVVFIVVVSSYMAFNVNYTKAFRMKNKIVDEYNKHQGACMVTKNDKGIIDSNSCLDNIQTYAKEIGYNPHIVANRCPDGYEDTNYYCYREVMKYSDDSTGDVVGSKKYHYYSIVTMIDINIPIVENILGLRLLSIKGDTKTFEVIEARTQSGLSDTGDGGEDASS